MLILFVGVNSIFVKVFVHFIFHLVTLCYDFIAKSGFFFYRFDHAEEVFLHLLG